MSVGSDRFYDTLYLKYNPPLRTLLAPLVLIIYGVVKYSSTRRSTHSVGISLLRMLSVRIISVTTASFRYTSL
jgi:hypothetical protein